MKYFFNPFLKYSEKQLFIVGVLGMILSIAASFYAKTAIVGIFRLEPVPKLTLLSAAAKCVAAYAVATVFLFILGKIFNSKTRFIDILNTVLVSQILNIFIIGITHIADFVQVAKAAGTTAIPVSQQLEVLFFALVTIPFMVYGIILYFNGFRTALNIKSWQQITIFCFSTFIFIATYQIVSQIINF